MKVKVLYCALNCTVLYCAVAMQKMKVKVINESESKSESESESESDVYIRGKAGHMAHSLPRQLSVYSYQFS